jgi:hypothetical protein
MKDAQNTKQQLFRITLFSIILVSAILQGCARRSLGSSGAGDGLSGGGNRAGPGGGLSEPVDASDPSGPIYRPGPDPRGDPKGRPDPRKPDKVKPVKPNVLR